MENLPLHDVDGQYSTSQSIHGLKSHLVLFSGCILVIDSVLYSWA